MTTDTGAGPDRLVPPGGAGSAAPARAPVRLGGRVTRWTPPPAPAPERALLATIRRLASRRSAADAGWSCLLVRLSRLRPADAPPGPRPHHRRVARALLQDAANAHDGQVFTLANEDLALVCPDATLHPGLHVSGAALPDVLHALLRADAPEPDSIIAVFPVTAVPEDVLATLASVRATAAEPAPGAPPAAAPRAATPAPDDAAPPQAFVDRELALHCSGGVLGPGFHAIAARPSLLRESNDPWLERHGAAGREAAARDAILHAIADVPDDIEVDLALAPQTVASAGFAALAAALRPGRGGIVLKLLDAASGDPVFATARRRIAAAGLRFVLDGGSHLALGLIDAGALQPDRLVLDWADGLMRLPDAIAEGLAATFAAVTPERIVLRGAPSETAIRWGRSIGIAYFTGPHAAAMLAATRMQVCPHAGGCSLRACVARAAATSQAGRAGCFNLPLLARGAP